MFIFGLAIHVPPQCFSNVFENHHLMQRLMLRRDKRAKTHPFLWCRFAFLQSKRVASFLTDKVPIGTVSPRMMKALLLISSFTLGLMHPTYSSQVWSESSFTSGFGPVTRADLIRFQIEKDYSLKYSHSKRDLYRIVQNAMNEANPKRVGMSIPESNKLAREVVNVGQCFGVDPIVLTALIWRESNFVQKSTSERGAVGLTQMTQTAVKEVLERLNPRSPRKLDHLRTLVKKCSPSLYERLPYEVSADTVAAWKNSVAIHATDALVMGTLLLKLNLASNYKYARKFEIYRSALEKYNGDPKVKIRFAKDVLTLAKRMISQPEIALNESKFLSSIRGL